MVVATRSLLTSALPSVSLDVYEHNDAIPRAELLSRVKGVDGE